MSKLGQIRIIVALILTVLVAVFTVSFLNQKSDLVTIIVANKNMEIGHLIAEEDLAIKEVSTETKEQLFSKVPSKKEDLIGTIVRKPIELNQPIIRDQEHLVLGDELGYALTEGGEVNQLYFVPEDSRLVTIETDQSGSSFYTLKKGDFVDVIYSSVDESTGGLYSTMILQHVKVFNIEKIATEGEGIIARKQCVTLVTTPENCLKLVAANRNGIIDLALNPLFGTTGDIGSVNVLSFRAGKPMTQEEKLDNLKAHIEELELTFTGKNMLLQNVKREKSIEALKESIDASTLDAAKKEQLKNLLN